MKLNVLSKTLAGSKVSFKFDSVSNKYIVKNFSENTAYVSFDESASVKSGTVRIPAGMGQVVESIGVGTDTVYVNGTGDVEVQQL